MNTPQDATASAPSNASAACRVLFPGRRLPDGSIDPRPITALLHPDGSLTDIALFTGREPHSTRYIPTALQTK